MKRFKLIIVLFFFSLISVEGWSQSIVFTPHWTPQSQFAGYYAALEMGFYEEEGLDVKIVHPTSSMSAIDMLKLGQSDIISSMLVDAIVAYDSGDDIINFMQLMPNSMMTIVSHEELDGDPSRLDGKMVGAWKAGFSIILRAILMEKGVDIQWVDFLSGVNVFLSESVDATTAMSYNELQTIRETGYDLKDSQVLSVADMGYVIPEDGLYTTQAFRDSDLESVQKFCEASIKGWLWVAQNREQAVEMVLKMAEQCNKPTNKHHQTMMLYNILSSDVATPQSDFKLQREDFKRACDLIQRAGIITNHPSYDIFVVDWDI